MRVKCNHCGECDAVCVGRYEDPDNPLEFACHECCGHGNEDGFCVMLAADDRALVEIDELEEKVGDLERKVAQLDGELDVAHGVIAELEQENDVLTTRISALEEQIIVAGGETPEGGASVH